MKNYLSKKYASLAPYVPGEQPTDRRYIKLNTNESPFPPCPGVIAAAEREAGLLNLYPDPDNKALTETVAASLGVKPSQVLMTAGSDEILNYAFMAFCDSDTPALFADITYGFYEVFANVNGVPFETVPLKDDFTIDTADYLGGGKTVFIANPNAPTGIFLPLAEIEKIAAANRDNVVVIDEAYIDFGGQSAVSLLGKYDNLLITRTFSKSRSLAGARLGMGIGSEGIIQALNTVKYSVNPYNVNRMTGAAGIEAIKDTAYTEQCLAKVIENREWTAARLGELGYTVLPSLTNFIFAKHPSLSGEEVYLRLKKAGILVRHFTKPRIADYNRITIGSKEQMQALIAELSKEEMK